MLDNIETNTEKIKVYLIQLGFFLTPPIRIHTNKLTQINEEFKEISNILTHRYAETLFENVNRVAIAITTKYHLIASLEDVNRIIQEIQQYIEDYLK